MFPYSFACLQRQAADRRRYEQALRSAVASRAAAPVFHTTRAAKDVPLNTTATALPLAPLGNGIESGGDAPPIEDEGNATPMAVAVRQLRDVALRCARVVYAFAVDISTDAVRQD